MDQSTSSSIPSIEQRRYSMPMIDQLDLMSDIEKPSNDNSSSGGVDKSPHRESSRDSLSLPEIKSSSHNVITEHKKFVKSLIANGTAEENVNYRCYLKVLNDGLLDKHRGRFLYICKGKLLNKSFKRIHDIFEYIPSDISNFANSQATIVYVPINYNS